jgi:iron complex outermembrane recepter protein
MKFEATKWVAMLFALIAIPLATAADTRTVYEFNLPEQTLSDALKAIGQQTTTNILFDPESVRNKVAPALRASLTLTQAIEYVLQGTDLRARQSAADTVLVRPKPKDAISAIEQAGETHPSSSIDSDAQGSDEQPQLEEIIVTAQKRPERLQDVPVPVTALNAAALVDSNQVLLREYFTSVPGLNLVPSIQSNQTLAIRGVTTGVGNPTVGIAVDDVPYGASTNIGGGRVVPDIDPGDLARLEVLRGPQGTLYGANSIGGLLKFVTRDPSFDRASARIQAGVDSVSESDELGYNVRGAFNLPLGESWAVGASAFTRRDSGYVDDPVRGVEDVNSADARGARLSALWKPSDIFTLKLSARVQEVEGDGAADVDPALGGKLQQSRHPGTGQYERESMAYSATATLRLGDADLTSITGYNVNSFSGAFDFTFALGAATQAQYGVRGTALLDDNETRKFSQEVRLIWPINERFDWLLGAFYTDEDSEQLQSVSALNPATSAQIATAFLNEFPSTYEELAAFTDLTIHVTERFDIQLGAR